MPRLKDNRNFMLRSVTEYHFVDEKEEPICFSALPVHWDKVRSPSAWKIQVFLHGKVDDGLLRIYKQSVAWKMELEGSNPEVWILSKDKTWMKLLKPRKAYEEIIRKILVTMQCLFYIKKNPASCGRALWENVGKTFSQFDIVPSEYDLLDHLDFIQAALSSDEMLSKSELLQSYVSDLAKTKRGPNIIPSIQRADFIVDNNGGGDDDIDADDVMDIEDCFDDVCAICDNGGELLCCEGDCLRSFHATRDTGVDSHCKTLGYTRAQVHDMPIFYCLNCLHKKHQCFACGKLGNSEFSSGAEVFRCISAACGHFYHPHCAASLIHPGDEAKATELAEKIAAGESFSCSIHVCCVCRQVENKENRELQFAICRRCPRSYHRKCLPRRISFKELEEEGIVQRAWDDLIRKRILIYCLKHKIEKNLATPIRNHITFPGTKNVKTAQLSDSRRAVFPKREAKDLSGGKVSRKLPRLAESSYASASTSANSCFDPEVVSLEKLQCDMQKESGIKGEVISLKKNKRTIIPHKLSNPHKSFSKSVVGYKITAGLHSSKVLRHQSIDDKAKKRIKLLVKQSPSSSLKVEDLFKRQNIPSTHAYSEKRVDKTITQGKVDASIKAIRAALCKIEKGCSIEDAKTVCGPDILYQMLAWKKKLRVYLAPFIYGMPYTSYGRHFTKMKKLKNIVERLHWYVKNGDTIVDFGCGANDFSILMKEKLEATGKKCLFKNYDIVQPKLTSSVRKYLREANWYLTGQNDFDFERKDWMTVLPSELPTGSRLIMGLIPPFGVCAALSNKFIDKALQFKPKLIILIVPKETGRLDKKSAAYDLIWEDDHALAGKSFYLSGSVDVDGRQIEQWNKRPPSLYLWSRSDWANEHKAIADRCRHNGSGTPNHGGGVNSFMPGHGSFDGCGPVATCEKLDAKTSPSPGSASGEPKHTRDGPAAGTGNLPLLGDVGVNRSQHHWGIGRSLVDGCGGWVGEW